MNEHGFFTIVGLCLLLVISLAIRTIQDTEKNYSYGAAGFQAECELQNAADGGLAEAVKKIQENPEIVPDKPQFYSNRRQRQYHISVSNPEDGEVMKNISVEVYGERCEIHQATRKYNSAGKITDTLDKDKSGAEIRRKGIVIISVASGEGSFGDKKYRRALAFILEDDGYKTPHYASD